MIFSPRSPTSWLQGMLFMEKEIIYWPEQKQIFRRNPPEYESIDWFPRHNGVFAIFHNSFLAQIDYFFWITHSQAAQGHFGINKICFHEIYHRVCQIPEDIDIHFLFIILKHGFRKLVDACIPQWKPFVGQTGLQTGYHILCYRKLTCYWECDVDRCLWLVGWEGDAWEEFIVTYFY